MKKDKEKKEETLSESFLMNFIENLIESSVKKEAQEPQITLAPAEIIPIHLKEQKLKTIEKYGPSLIQDRSKMIYPEQSKKSQKVYPQVISQKTKETMIPSSMMSKKENISAFPINRQETIAPIKLQQFSQSMISVLQQKPFERILPLINNPMISSVECPGHGKNFIINKSGLIQAISMSLTQEEIDEIMDEFSSKTKIPLIKGVFRAALGNLIISAVLSDFVGTRFHIEKIHPMQQPPMPGMGPSIYSPSMYKPPMQPRFY